MTRARLLALPKAELHVHLDGSLRPPTLLDLARERGVTLPATDPARLARHMVASDARDLEGYLTRFELTLAVLQDAPALERAAYELAEDNRADGVRYLEVRWCPALNTREGLSLEEAVAAPLRGLAKAQRELGIRTAAILCAMRTLPPEVSRTLAELAVAFEDQGVVGFDLAGAERGYPAEPHRAAFELARRAGLGVTIHAGEAAGPDSIREAIDGCLAGRIGHGTRLREDPELETRVRELGIPLEVCLTSNVQTHVVPSYEAHPLGHYLEAGLAVTLNTDNRLVSGTTLTDEYLRAHRHLGLGWDQLVAIARMGFANAFLPVADKAALTALLDGETRPKP